MFSPRFVIIVFLILAGHEYQQNTSCEMHHPLLHADMATPWWHLITTSMYLEEQPTALCQMTCTATTLTHRHGLLWLHVMTHKFLLDGCVMLQL